MIKSIFLFLFGAILISWGLMQIDFINDAFSTLISNINLEILDAFGDAYLKLISYNYLMLLIAMFVIFYIIGKFIDWIKG